MLGNSEFAKVSPNDLPRTRLHAYLRADVCVMCGGKLKGPSGEHCETVYDDGKVVFGVAICRTCKIDELEHGSRLPKNRAVKKSSRSTRNYTPDEAELPELEEAAPNANR